MNIVRRTTLPRVGLWGLANPVLVGIWPGRLRSLQPILYVPGTESPPGITDTSLPCILPPPLPIGLARSAVLPASSQSWDQRPGCRPDTPNTRTHLHQSLESSGTVQQPRGHHPKFIEPRSVASISTCQYPLARSRLQKNLAPPRVLRMSSICGSG